MMETKPLQVLNEDALECEKWWPFVLLSKNIHSGRDRLVRKPAGH